jgi:hypothetical protein
MKRYLMLSSLVIFTTLLNGKLRSTACGTDNWSSVTTPYSWASGTTVGNFNLVSGNAVSITSGSSPLTENTVICSTGYLTKYTSNVSANFLSFTAHTWSAGANGAFTMIFNASNIPYTIGDSYNAVIFAISSGTYHVTIERFVLGSPPTIIATGTPTSLTGTHTLTVTYSVSGSVGTFTAYVDGTSFASGTNGSLLAGTKAGWSCTNPTWCTGNYTVCQ